LRRAGLCFSIPDRLGWWPGQPLDIVPNVNKQDAMQTTRNATTSLADFLAGLPDDGRRVTLRLAASSDQDEFTGLVRDSAGLHHPWTSLPAGPEEFRRFLGRFDHVSGEGFLVCLRETGAIAGNVNISSIIRGRFQNGSLGYAAFAPAAGQGYMTEGLGLVIRYAFEGLRLHRLDAQIQPGNHASLRLVQRLGFRHEGYSPDLLFIDGAWRGHERWAITSDMMGFCAPPHPTLPER
jgi:[ribosomal protein S5]-alanine N-acetyltransferase